MKEKNSPVPEHKLKEVEEVTKILDSDMTVAVVNLENLPAKQYQAIRRKLRDQITLKMTKKNIIKRAMEKSSKPKIKELEKYLSGVPALIFTKLSAFELFKILKDNRSSAAAKQGQISPEDIWVQEGLTEFVPGPIMSELGSLGIKTKVEGGKLAIIKDTLVVKEGEEFTPLAASIVARLGIQPMKLGINLVSVLEAGEIYEAKVLDIDVDEYINKIRTASTDAFKLALGIGIVNSDTVEHMVKKAHMEAKAVAVAQDILTSETTKEIVSKANAQAEALKNEVKE